MKNKITLLILILALALFAFNENLSAQVKATNKNLMQDAVKIDITKKAKVGPGSAITSPGGGAVGSGSAIGGGAVGGGTAIGGGTYDSVHVGTGTGNIALIPTKEGMGESEIDVNNLPEVNHLKTIGKFLDLQSVVDQLTPHTTDTETLKSLNNLVKEFNDATSSTTKALELR